MPIAGTGALPLDAGCAGVTSGTSPSGMEGGISGAGPPSSFFCFLVARGGMAACRRPGLQAARRRRPRSAPPGSVNVQHSTLPVQCVQPPAKTKISFQQRMLLEADAQQARHQCGVQMRSAVSDR